MGGGGALVGPDAETLAFVVEAFSLMHKVLALCCSSFIIKSCLQVCLELFSWRSDMLLDLNFCTGCVVLIRYHDM